VEEKTEMKIKEVMAQQQKENAEMKVLLWRKILHIKFNALRQKTRRRI
jgi:hypothetical protein